MLTKLMANKQKESKPGSRYAGIPWDDGRLGRRSFNDMIDVMKKKKNTGYYHDGNEGNANSLPMKRRKENVLEYIRSRGEYGALDSQFESAVLKQLIKDGDVFLHRPMHNNMPRGKNLTSVIATSFPEPIVERVAVPHAKKQAELMEAGLHYPGKNKGKVRVDDTQTIKWTKQKDQQLILDVLAGTADEELVQKVGKTKTKMRKIRKIAK